MSTHGKLPSTVQLQEYIKNADILTVTTADGNSHTGILRWFDEVAFCLDLADERRLTIMRSSIIGYWPDKSA